MPKGEAVSLCFPLVQVLSQQYLLDRELPPNNSTYENTQNRNVGVEKAESDSESIEWYSHTLEPSM